MISLEFVVPLLYLCKPNDVALESWNKCTTPALTQWGEIISDEAFLFLCTFAFTRNAKFFKFSNSKCISCGNLGIDKYQGIPIVTLYSYCSILQIQEIGMSGYICTNLVTYTKFKDARKIAHTVAAYCKVTSSNTSRIEAHAGFFRLLLKGIFDPYVLRPFDKKLIS